MASPTAFLGKAGPLVAARFVSACITVSIPLVLARVMDLAEYGAYKQLFLVSQTLYFVLPFGVAQSLYFFIPRAEQRRPWFGQTLLFLLGAGTLAAVILYRFAPQLSGWLNSPALFEHRVLLALYCGSSMAGYPLELSMTSQGNTRGAAIGYLVSDALRSVALTAPALLGFGLHGMMLSMCVFSFVRLAATWWVMVGHSEGPLWDGPSFRRQLAYAAPFGAAILVSVPQHYAHQFMVSSVVSPELFAIYAVGCFQVPLVDLLYSPTSEVLMVQIGALERTGRIEEAAIAFREATARLAFVFLPLAAFLFAAAPEFIGAVFGARFADSVPIFQIFLLGIPLAALPMDGTLRARNKTRHIFLSYLVKALVTVPLVYFGVTWLGMKGGAFSWLLAELVGKAMLLAKVPGALSTENQQVGLGALLPWGRLAKAAGAAVLAALAVIALRAWVVPMWGGAAPTFAQRLVPLAVAGVLFGAGYLAVLRAAGVPPAHVLAALWPRRAA